MSTPFPLYLQYHVKSFFSTTLRIFLIELISIYSLTNHSQKKLANFLSGKNQLLCEKLRILLAKINSKEIDKLEKLNREIHHDRKLKKSPLLQRIFKLLKSYRPNLYIYERPFSIMFIVSCQVFFINYFEDIFDGINFNLFPHSSQSKEHC